MVFNAAHRRLSAGCTNIFKAMETAKMAFARETAGKWRKVPGAWWFKADLHIHTVDDHQGGRAKFPAEVNGLPEEAATLTAYARRFLQSAANNQVLSLLLETKDDRPLVIDQPEDELDNRFLFETVLPALKRLKGCRQIIIATHNANIVVNGDAEQMIQLEATANKGRVACAGAIEEPAVRDTIVRTVDGGDEAFRLRRIKYGF